jgi:hypothetical protein
MGKLPSGTTQAGAQRSSVVGQNIGNLGLGSAQRFTMEQSLGASRSGRNTGSGTRGKDISETREMLRNESGRGSSEEGTTSAAADIITLTDRSTGGSPQVEGRPVVVTDEEIEEIIEEREEILDDAGGSQQRSETTKIVGDEEDEGEPIIYKPTFLGFSKEYTDDGFLTYFIPRYYLGAPTKQSNDISIARVEIKAGGEVMYDYTPVSLGGDSTPLKLEVRATTGGDRGIDYSPAERNSLFRDRIQNQRLSNSDLRQSMLNFFEVEEVESLQSSVLTNRIESKKSIKLTALSASVSPNEQVSTSPSSLLEPATSVTATRVTTSTTGGGGSDGTGGGSSY